VLSWSRPAECYDGTLNAVASRTSSPHTKPARPVATPADTVLTPGWRFLVGWTTAWAVVGVGVAVGISFGAGVEFGPVLRLSLLFAQVVGYSA